MHIKKIIITGANRGIGRATALALAQEGFSLILACRDLKAGESVAAEIREKSAVNVEARYIDLTKFDTIRAFASKVDECHVLINCAGVMCGKKTIVNGIENTCLTNHFGYYCTL